MPAGFSSRDAVDGSHCYLYSVDDALTWQLHLIGGDCAMDGWMAGMAEASMPTTTGAQCWEHIMQMYGRRPLTTRCRALAPGNPVTVSSCFSKRAQGQCIMFAHKFASRALMQHARNTLCGAPATCTSETRFAAWLVLASQWLLPSTKPPHGTAVRPVPARLVARRGTTAVAGELHAPVVTC